MATLPADRTKLALAQSNQNPQNVLGSSQNKNALTEAYDTIDLLYGSVTGLISSASLSKLGMINVMDYNASGSSQTTTGSITIGTSILTLTSALEFKNGQGICINGKAEVDSLQITAAATVSSNVTVTLNGVAFLVAVLAGDTIAQVATKIRAATYVGWTTGGVAGSDTITFTSTTTGTRTTPTYSAGTTTAAGTMTVTTLGSADFITSIVSGGGTTTLTLAVNASSTATSQIVRHDDTAAIQSAINSIPSATYSKGGGCLVFPTPNGCYNISSTLDFTEKWNVKIMCPTRYSFQRQSVTNIDTDYALFHWYGSINTPMMLFDYSFGITLENISFNGRNIAGVVGLSLSKAATAASSAKFITGTNVDAKYCDIGIRIGDVAANGPDDAAILFTNSYLANNTTTGLKVNSGNAQVDMVNLFCLSNGETPAGGTNVLLLSGELSLQSYTSTGKPKRADIGQDAGGLRIHSAWSDVDQGLFIDSSRADSSSVLSGVRHYSGPMTTSNTPKSIIWQGPQPLVLEGCQLFNSVECNQGQSGHVIDLGTRFITAGATFIGTAVTTSRGYIGIGTGGQNEARLSLGKPPRTDMGLYMPLTIHSDTLQTGLIRSAGTLAVSEMLNAGDNSHQTMVNAYYDGTNYRSVAAGRCSLFFNSGLHLEYSKFTSTVAGEIITWSSAFDVNEYYNGYSISLFGHKQIWETGVPIGSAWTRGDICWNINATVGQPNGWRCTVAGTPGTWVPMANL